MGRPCTAHGVAPCRQAGVKDGCGLLVAGPETQEGEKHEKPTPQLVWAFDVIYPGSDLLSHAVAHAVPSALEGLTSVFEMGTGVSPPLWPPGIVESASGSLHLNLVSAMYL